MLGREEQPSQERPGPRPDPGLGRLTVAGAARLTEWELEAAWQDHDELAEARIVTPGESRD